MANIKSAKKRIDVTRRNTLRNKIYKSTIKTYTKRYLIALDKYKLEKTDANLAVVKSELASTYQKIDKATKVNVLHKNTAARKKSQLHKALTTI
uniref:ribosomal protein S20 n=1 Tax=Meringosphaera mediterranea TaxID=2837474 RepID=UPI002869FD4E|nr:ribosomal protein S20 [Meringosphaera mediterranea]WLD05753.1 ribosomal protein S20 [Meringosphaera mediterranea]WLD05837.1 ribosomal protein S20 [Meringosphaera mediterranea]WLD06057.1 ribosomal protein S20 [Meringosphaera mediterranea]